METVRWDKLISDEQWDDVTRSDVDFEKQRDKISKDAGKRCNEDPDKKSRTISHPDVGLPVLITEESLALKLAKKPNQNDLRRVWTSCMKAWHRAHLSSNPTNKLQ